jgi:hypothetical protein
VAGDVTNFATLVNDDNDSSLGDDPGSCPSLCTYNQGIDFVYFLELSTLSVCVRFQRTSVYEEVAQEHLKEV